MVSLQTQPSAGKSRSRIVVKPILKRLHHVHSHHSERNSLDLNRGWDDQPVATTPDVEYGSFDFGSRDLDDLSADRRNTYGGISKAKAKLSLSLSRDVGEASSNSPSSLGLGRANTFSGASLSHPHSRSPSVVAAPSSSSNNNNKPSTSRVGSFVHPFQQTPRTSTPPLRSYANSLSSIDKAQQRDLAGAIAESDGDGDGDGDEPLASPASLTFGEAEPASPSKKPSTSSSLRSAGGRPSLSGSQRSSSGPSVQRPAQQGQVNHDAVAVPLLISTTQQKSAASIPVTSTSSPISPFRTSLDINGFRLRSRSEMDSVSRQEQVREARRKFEAKEREKEEKYAREQIRKREKTERRKTSFGHTSTLSSARNSSSVREKNEAEPLNGRAAGDAAPSRSKTAKRRTNSLWTAFILWLRTRLLKLARR
ncbi:hypothetical protein ACQKWADRAFT_278874 [Trichoderma austrokoningii]